ncbi:nicotinate-nucleotide--dimethylbenzimidazole phosphoribosyltransferase [Halomonas garicola]|uniref:nicotinate-nucleotide--dimethylbenzimidazole phosphoribosyltransferase n=1 Tax=Halomonas garicola TaxID=1690008 RepID=UPI00289B401A|nr:nicotinate-nucleotide--dimethylbenzimidazole phosphoribosyltransferase [Halomonas garicola]
MPPLSAAPAIKALAARVRPVNRRAANATRAYLDTLTKPPGSLGRVEALAVQLGGIIGQTSDVSPPACIVFAADHGVAAEGVSAFSQDVTAQMVANFAAGGAAINVFAGRINARVEVVDVGVAGDVEAPGVVNAKVRRGTASMLRGPAMSREDAEASLDAGVQAAGRALDAGCRCLIVGEMGIANTTAASAVLAVLSGQPAAHLVGTGTGIRRETLAHKISVIERAVNARPVDPREPLEVLASVGGLEIGAMAGAYIAGAARGVPCVVDGFIATVAALLAARLCPEVRGYLIFGHRSAEPGHNVALEALHAEPLLALGMRLGEGTGAALAFPLLDAACAMLRDMATFSDAGVDDSRS